MREKLNVYKILVRKPEGKRPLGRPICRWEDTIEINFIGISWGGTDWIDLAHGKDQWRALLNMVMNNRVPQHFEKFLSS
jgi:hypothetical protein